MLSITRILPPLSPQSSLFLSVVEQFANFYQDADGREIVPVHKVFFVGKFCMGNAQTAHALQHWKYHLNEWVVTWLTKNGYLKPAEIVKRDSWKERKRRKHANKIADRMEKEGVTQQLWKDFRANIDQARDAKQGGRW